MINFYAKCKVSVFTCYGNTKGNAKCINYGDFGGYGSLKVIRNVTI